MRRVGGRRRLDERGIAAPSSVAVLSVVAVALAGVAFVATDGDQPEPVDTARPVTATPSTSPVPRETAPKSVLEEKEQKKPKRKQPTSLLQPNAKPKC